MPPTFIPKLLSSKKNKQILLGILTPSQETFNFPDGKNDDRWYHWCIDNWGTKWDINLGIGNLTSLGS